MSAAARKGHIILLLLVIAAATLATVAVLMMFHAQWVGFDFAACHGFYSKGWCLR